MPPQDPLTLAREEVRELRGRLLAAKARVTELAQARGVWPKLVRVTVSRGTWGEDVMAAFAQIGWTADGRGTNLGPQANGKYIAAQAWLTYEAHEDGTLTLVAAEDQDFGKVERPHSQLVEELRRVTAPDYPLRQIRLDLDRIRTLLEPPA